MCRSQPQQNTMITPLPLKDESLDILYFSEGQHPMTAPKQWIDLMILFLCVVDVGFWPKT